MTIRFQMVTGKYTIKFHQLKTNFKSSFYKTSNPHFRISDYATTSTAESVFIIGGWTGSTQSSKIAKYSDGSWTKPGSLKKSRSSHGAITIEGITMIIGGWDGTIGST